MTSETDSKKSVTLVVDNNQTEGVTLCIEPWATEYDLPPKSNLRVVGEGPGEANLEISLSKGRMTVFA